MDRLRTISFLLVLMAFSGRVMSQSSAESYALVDSLNGTELSVPPEGAFLTDDNAQPGGFYSPNKDYSITLTLQQPCAAPYRYCLEFNLFDIGPNDTLYIYDGPSTLYPLLLKCNNAVNRLGMGRSQVFVSPENTTNSLTIRLVSGDGGDVAYQGFSCFTSCATPCEKSEPFISSTYYRMRNGVVYDSARVKRVAADGSDAVYDCVNICAGDQLVLKGYGRYTSYHGYYTPADSTSTFVWDMGIDRTLPLGPDTLMRRGITTVQTDFYSDTVGCYDILLYITDVNGCGSSVQGTVRVRISSNPIRTISSSLPTFCSDDSLLVLVGGDINGTACLILDTMHTNRVVSRVNEVKTFIPDGPRCPVRCYDAPVVFTEFPNSRTVASKDDICSICVNYEHSFMGDYDLKIICPSGQSATLKYKENPGGMPTGSYGGGGTYTGYPYGGSSDGLGDCSDDECDSTKNMYGVGLDYCFSRNGAYTLVDGNPADVAFDGDHYLGNSAYIDDVTFTFENRTGVHVNNCTSDAGTRSFSTKHPSDYENKLDYYKPADDFRSLIGCPLNGTWQIEICDNWGADNGWVFSWSMDICQVMDNRDCKYDVAIDSVRWALDTTAGRYVNGRFVGPYVHRHNDSVSYVLMADTAGSFPLIAHVYDDFGCQWDTSTSIKSIWVPRPELGKTRKLCNDAVTQISADDPHEQSYYTYSWLPNGETTKSVNTTLGYEPMSQIPYIVTVTNNEDETVAGCSGSDTVMIDIYPQPLLNFDASIYPMEQCAPLEETFTNHSQYADSYLWVFGDGSTSADANPTHVFQAGVYDVSFYASNRFGCKDSLIMPNLVTVYPYPKADFSWSPVYPTGTSPVATFENKSVPLSDEIRYVWEMQHSADNEYSFQTVEEMHPTYTWSLGEDNCVASYKVRLMAINENTSPSGQLFQCGDTVENVVTIINDFIQFPTLVTPNGDGVNDLFIIKNLVCGGAYPDNRLDIYNRWGMRVFHAENIDDEKDFWDPAATNAPAGTYFWRFFARGFVGVVERNGVIEVVR